jgi:hypothetical protein
MARWTAIVALLLGVGFTAFESFTTPARRESPVTIQMTEGGSGFPTPPPYVAEGGSGFPTPPPYVSSGE